MPLLSRARQKACAAVDHADGGLERFLLEYARALRHRGQSRGYLSQCVQRGVETGRLSGDDLQDARVLDRHTGHRAEIVEGAQVLLAEPGIAATAQAQSADHAGLASDGGDGLVDRPAQALRLKSAVNAFVFSDEIAQHGFAVAHTREGAIDGIGGRLVAVEDEVGVVGLEHQRAAGFVADHLGPSPDHHLQHLVHRLPGGLFDKLVHQ